MCAAGALVVQVRFDTLSTPNLRYEVNVLIRVGTKRIFYDQDAQGNVVESVQTAYEYQALDDMPLEFISVVGTIMAECYSVTGALLDTHTTHAGDLNNFVVAFAPGEVCGDRPEAGVQFDIVLTNLANPNDPTPLFCEDGAFEGSSVECPFQLTELVASTYELRVMMGGVVIGCRGKYLDCENPYHLQVKAAVPSEKRSVVLVPATFVLQAGRNTADLFDTELVLADMFGNLVDPNSQDASVWAGPYVRYTSPTVMDPVYATVEYLASTRQYLARTDNLTDASDVYTVTAYFYSVETAAEVLIPPFHGQLSTQIDVVPNTAEPQFSLYSGTGAAAYVTADDEARLSIHMYDRFMNPVVSQQALSFWLNNMRVAVARSDGGLGATVMQAEVNAAKGSLDVPYTATQAGMYTVSVSFFSSETRSYVLYQQLSVESLPGALDAANSYVFGLPRGGVLAGREAEFLVRALPNSIPRTPNPLCYSGCT